MHLDPRVWDEELPSLYIKCQGSTYTAIWFGIHVKFPFVLQSTAPSMLTRNLYFSVLSILLFGFICCRALCLCWFVSAKPQREEWLRFLDRGWQWRRRVLEGFTLGAQTWMGKPRRFPFRRYGASSWICSSAATLRFWYAWLWPHFERYHF